MIFLEILAALAVIQIFGSAAFFHRDSWFSDWCEKMSQLGFVQSTLGVGFLVSLVPALLLLWMVMAVLNDLSLGGINILVGIVILLYSFGRGEFTALVNEYVSAAHGDDWDSALIQAKLLGVDLDADSAPENWGELHRASLIAAGYKGLERIFAVIFWFILLGPLGALCYRLTQLYLQFYRLRTGDRDGLVTQFLWLMEWPVVRVLGFTFALTGNFLGCMQRWHETLFCVERPSGDALASAVRGALCINDDGQLSEETQLSEMKVLVSLFSRTLVCWLCILALIILVA